MNCDEMCRLIVNLKAIVNDFAIADGSRRARVALIYIHTTLSRHESAAFAS